MMVIPSHLNAMSLTSQGPEGRQELNVNYNLVPPNPGVPKSTVSWMSCFSHIIHSTLILCPFADINTACKCKYTYFTQRIQLENILLENTLILYHLTMQCRMEPYHIYQRSHDLPPGGSVKIWHLWHHRWACPPRSVTDRWAAFATVHWVGW